MAQKTRAEQAAEDRRRRAEEALKANLKRRKEQARARKVAGEADGLAPAAAAAKMEPAQEPEPDEA